MLPELKLGTYIKTEFKCVNIWIYAGCVSGCWLSADRNLKLWGFRDVHPQSWYFLIQSLFDIWDWHRWPCGFAWGRQTDEVCIVLPTSHSSDSLVSISQNLWVFYLHATALHRIGAGLSSTFVFATHCVDLYCQNLSCLMFLTYHEVHASSWRWSRRVFCSASVGFRQRRCFSQSFMLCFIWHLKMTLKCELYWVILELLHKANGK